MIAKIKKAVSYFTAVEIILWAVSVLLITSSFFIFARREYLTLAASLVGVTSLIFCAKGNPAGQALMIVFSAMYGVISFTFAYYGEMMTYLGMSAPTTFTMLRPVTATCLPYLAEVLMICCTR